MLEALIAGQRDPAVLADLAKRQLRNKIPAPTEALQGRFNDHHAFMVRLYLDRIDAHEADIARLDARIEEAIAPLSVLGTPVKVDPLGISAVGPRSRSVLGAVDPVVGVKVERSERSEDERP